MALCVEIIISTYVCASNNFRLLKIIDNPDSDNTFSSQFFEFLNVIGITMMKVMRGLNM
jgi:hypothetical protein